MKRVLSASFTAVLLLCLAFLPGLAADHSRAAGVVLLPHANLSASATSAVADGTSTITITATFYVYTCNNDYVMDDVSDCDSYGGVKNERLFTGFESSCPYSNTITVDISVSGEALLSKTSVCGGATATDTFTIASSVAGTKTLTATTRWSYGGSAKIGSGVSVNFAAPAAAPTPTKKQTTPSTPTPAPVPTPTPPAIPTLSTLTADGTQVKTDHAVSLEQGKPLVLSGKTIANGKITLYVFSDPKQFTTTADKDGNWSIMVKDLPTGNHHAEVEVTDPATNQTSARAKLLEFSVVATKASTKNVRPRPAQAPNTTGVWIGLGAGALAVLAGGAAGFIIYKRRHGKKSSTLNDNIVVDK